MSELARQSGVPAPTIKHYIREGLLPSAELRTSKNMAYYDPRLIPRIRAIKEAQRSRFLPLSVIREALDDAALDAPLDEALIAIEHSLKEKEGKEKRTRRQLIEAGMPEEELDFFVSLGAITPVRGPRGEDVFAGDDLQLLQTLGAARRAGISPLMLPHTTIGPYVSAIRNLVRIELEMFRKGVVPQAGENLQAIVPIATALSERLVVLLRRKLLLPTLREIAAEPRVHRVSRKPSAPTRAKPPARRPKPAKRRAST